MSHEVQIQTRLRERQELLDRATRLLRDDRRVVAAWLVGSLGRGDADEWSDIDLWIVVADHTMDAIAGERHEFLTSEGPSLLTIEAPQNAPPGGAYLLAMYPGARGPHILDCSWQPQSEARRPPNTVLLFDRAGIPMAESAQPLPAEEVLGKAISQIRFFWMMAAIVAKYIARRNSWEVLNLLAFLSTITREIEWLAGRRASRPTYHDHPDFDPPLTPDPQLMALRHLMDDVSRLIAETPALMDAVTPQTVEQVQAICFIVEQLPTHDLKQP